MLALLLVGLSSTNAEAPFYFPLELHEMIARAELCFTGTIVDLDADTIQVEVEQWGFGEPQRTQVEVVRFQDWACARRWTPYALGQRCLYFVDSRLDGSWRILSGGGEGEMPLTGERVGLRGKVPERLCEAGSKMALDPFLVECRRYRAVFRYVERDSIGWNMPRGETQDVEDYLRSSPLSEFLALETFEGGLGGWYRDPSASSPRPAEARIDLGIGFLPSAVASLPDLDGDGAAGLVCAFWSGLVYLNLAADGTLRGQHSLVDEAWGSALAGLGDLDDDGTFELAVCEPASSTTGQMRVLSIDARGSIQRQRVIEQVDAGLEFGRGLATLGDLDGDGTLEVAVSAGESVAWAWVWLVSLDERARVARTRLLLDGDEFVRGPLALAPLGDLDGNGAGDFAAAVHDDLAGRVHLFFLTRDGSLASRRQLVLGGKRGFPVGGAIAGPGDWNGDGTPDLVVGGRNDSLRVLCLAADGSLLTELELPPPPGLHAEASFGSTLAVLQNPAGPRLLAAGFSWMEERPGPSEYPQFLRRYPSLWSFERPAGR